MFDESIGLGHSNGYADSGLVMVDLIRSTIGMVDLAFWDDFFKQIGHGTTLGRSFQAVRSPTKIL